jgi:hypothetical protein
MDGVALARLDGVVIELDGDDDDDDDHEDEDVSGCK